MHVYRDPTDPTRPPRNLVRVFMDLAPNPKQAPEENQLTECVAWLVARSPAFARALAGYSLERASAGKALELATQFAVDTRVTLPHPCGKGVLFPDPLICGDLRSFELLVEVKAGSTPHSYLHGDEVLLQPDMYAKAWRALPPASQADELFVGTLTNNFAFSDRGDPIRAGDVTWDQLRGLLTGMLNRGELDADVRLVARDLLDVIEERVLAAAGELPPHTDALLEAARLLIDDASSRLVGLLPAGEARQPARIEKDYTGRYVEFMAPEGATFELWLFATVAGGQYNLFGLGDVPSHASPRSAPRMIPHDCCRRGFRGGRRFPAGPTGEFGCHWITSMVRSVTHTHSWMRSPKPCSQHSATQTRCSSQRRRGGVQAEGQGSPRSPSLRSRPSNSALSGVGRPQGLPHSTESPCTSAL